MKSGWSSKETQSLHTNLLIGYNEVVNQCHYFVITNMQRLVETQYTRGHISGQFCDLRQTFYITTGTRHKRKQQPSLKIWRKRGDMLI